MDFRIKADVWYGANGNDEWLDCLRASTFDLLIYNWQGTLLLYEKKIKLIILFAKYGHPCMQTSNIMQFR